MPIDSSIYQGLKQYEVPDPMAAAGKAMTLSHLAAQTAKSEEDTKSAALGRVALKAMPSLIEFNSLPEEKKPGAFNQVMQRLADEHAIPMHNVPINKETGEYQYSPEFVKRTTDALGSTKEWREANKALLENKKLEADTTYAAESRDPNSEISKRAAKVAVGLGIDTNGLSYDQTSKLAPIAEKAREADVRSQDHRVIRDQKQSTDQDKTYTEMRNHLETFRGNQAAKQASLDVYSANKAIGIVANKDPNTLTTQDLALLTSELAKVATGGVPTESGIHHLMPNNLSTKFSEMQSFLSSKPSDADAGEYVKHNMVYLKEMTGEANKTLNGFRSNIIKGYRARIRPGDYKETMNDYGISDGTEKLPAANNFDPDVLDYAKQHGITPEQSQSIKKQRTGQ